MPRGRCRSPAPPRCIWGAGAARRRGRPGGRAEAGREGPPRRPNQSPHGRPRAPGPAARRGEARRGERGAGSGEGVRGPRRPEQPGCSSAACSGQRLPAPGCRSRLGCGCLSQSRSFLNAPYAWHWGATVFVPCALLPPPPSFTRRWGYPTSSCVP